MANANKRMKEKQPLPKAKPKMYHKAVVCHLDSCARLSNSLCKDSAREDSEMNSSKT